jgi:hypothetical protein
VPSQRCCSSPHLTIALIEFDKKLLMIALESGSEADALAAVGDLTFPRVTCCIAVWVHELEIVSVRPSNHFILRPCWSVRPLEGHCLKVGARSL